MSDTDNIEFGYEKLLIWQRSLEWADRILTIAESIGTKRNHFRLVEQMESACTSVPMNIAEGKGRFSKKEFVHFLYIARGSLYETMTLLEIFLKRHWVPQEEFIAVKNETIEIAKM
ncbi:MAG: four helix bundle protein, partial [Desulfosalsimonadaceae bacterium]|nr:four helix bundle protein [Desulfosalsimonadaceae bacterium]